MKKHVILPLIALVAMGLASCGNASSSGISSSIFSSESSSSSSEEVLKTLSISVSGTTKVGEDITFVASYDNSPIVDQKSVVYTANPATSMTITNNKASLLEAGDVTVTATYTPTGASKSVTATKVVTIEEGVIVSTIADAKKNATATPAPIRVKGVVTATYGKGGYIDDGTDAILIYNWYSTKTDTGITKQADGQYGLTLGSRVEVYAYIYTYYGMAELSKSYKSGDNYIDLEGAYLIADTKGTYEATAVKAVGETEIKALTSNQSGLRYSFDATYVSGAPAVESKTFVKFTVGATSITLVTDKKETHTKLTDDWNALGLVAGDNVHITTPFNQLYSSKNELDFSYFSYGTEIVKHDLSVSATDNHYVGQTMTLSSLFAGEAVTDVTYAITSGSEYATLSGSSLSVIGAGTVVVSGSATIDSVAYTKSITITTRDLSVVSSIADAKALDDGEYVTIKGQVVADNGKFSAVVADATDGMFVYIGDSYTTDTGLDTDGYVIASSYVSITGSLSTYNGVKEITMNHKDAGTIPACIVTADALTAMSTTSIADETAFNAAISSTKALTNGGKIYSLNGVFESLSSRTATFKIGSTEFYVYFASAADATSANLVKDSTYTITGAYQIYNSKPEFIMMKNGTSVSLYSGE